MASLENSKENSNPVLLKTGFHTSEMADLVAAGNQNTIHTSEEQYCSPLDRQKKINSGAAAGDTEGTSLPLM